ncbi:N-formylglutamate amidohydrolase [Fulvimarina manganoxydans]|uniref:N-formylglutamate amidohydrolase n=1 Tax=Fulvimarina manganoxydans TaxID=937218 RepID=UPI000A055138|nr:N-formylglutamate amidohydrolase [Fulvimarina manganoxydans]
MQDSATPNSFASAASGSVLNASGAAPLVLVCEHASPFIPEVFGRLGLDEESASAHIAWDPGALDVAKAMSEALNAPLVAANYSRLLYDLNRPPEAATAMPERSETYDVPGNRDLDDAAKKERIAALYHPFHALVAATIEDVQKRSGQAPALVTIHSFTPVYFGQKRETELGILFDADDRLAQLMLARAPGFTRLTAEPNQPYSPADGVLHTLEMHGAEKNLPRAMLEIRNDLVATKAAADLVAGELAGLLAETMAIMDLETGRLSRPAPKARAVW